MSINKLDSAIDLVAQMRFLLNETFYTIAENCDSQETFDYWYLLQQVVQLTWEENKPSEYVLYSEFADD